MKYSKELQDLLFYRETTSKVGYTTTEQECIDPDRLELPDFWIKSIDFDEPAKKNLIFADSEISLWRLGKHYTIKSMLQELLDNGFKLYLWQKGSLVLLTDLLWLDDNNTQQDVTYASDTNILNEAFKQHHLTPDKTCMLKSHEINLFCVASMQYLTELPPKLSETVIQRMLNEEGSAIDYCRMYLCSQFHDVFNASLQELDVNRLSQLEKIFYGQSYDSEPLVERLAKIKIDIVQTLLLQNNSKIDQYWCDECVPYVNSLRLLELRQKDIPIHIVIQILKAASYLKQLNLLSNYAIEENLSDFNWSELSDLRLVHPKQSLFEAILTKKFMPNLKLLLVDNAIIVEPFAHELPEQYLETLKIVNSKISADNLVQILSKSHHCKHLIIANCQDRDIPSSPISSENDNLPLDSNYIRTQLNAMINALDRLINKLDINFTHRKYDGLSFPSIESLTLIGQEVSNYSGLFKAVKNLKELSLEMGSFVTLEQFYFPHLEALSLKGLIASDQLKVLLENHKTLRILDLSQCEFIWIDQALQDLLDKIKEVHLPKNLYKTLDPPITSQVSFSIPRRAKESDSKSPVKVIQTVESDKTSRAPEKERAVDADTQDNPNQKMYATQYFYALDGQEDPNVNHYRLAVYDHLDTSPDADIHSAFILKNKADLGLKPLEAGAITYEPEDVMSLDAVTKAGCYYGKQAFDLTEQWQPIASLTPTDVITHYHLSNREGVEIQYSSRDDLYYIKSTTGHQTVIMDFLVKSAVEQPVLSNPDIQQLVADFNNPDRSKKALDIQEDNPTGDTYLKALREQKTGSCRQRAIEFKDWMNRHYSLSIDVRIIHNDCHAFVEVKETPAGPWITCDLGGYDGDMQITKSIDNLPDVSKKIILDNAVELAQCEEEPECIEEATSSVASENEIPEYLTALREHVLAQQAKKRTEKRLEQLASNKTKKNVLPSYYNQTLYCRDLLNGTRPNDNTFRRKQLIEIASDQLQNLHMALQEAAKRNHQSVMYIQSPDELMLLKAEAICETSVFIINYANFPAAAIVNAHSFLDGSDGRLPAKAIVIGLIDPDKYGRYDGEDFTSRFNIKERCPMDISRTDPPAILPTTSLEPDAEKITIDLCHSSAWITQLMGGWIFRHGVFVFEEGELVQALKQHRPIEILNPPRDEAFDVFWRQARVHSEIRYRHQVISLPSEQSIVYDERYDWDDPLSRVVDYHPSTEDNPVHPLNPNVLNCFLSCYRLDEDKKMDKQAGILQDHAKNKSAFPLNIVVTRQLTTDQWGVFFNAIKKVRKDHPDFTFSLQVAPDVTLPFKAVHTDFSPLHTDEKTRCIHSTDSDFTIANLLKHDPEPWRVIDISSFTAGDLVRRLKCLDPKERVFTEAEQVLLTHLRDGENIILTGNFSDALMDGLAPFLMDRLQNSAHAAGKLILVSQKPWTFLESTIEPKPEAKAKEALLREKFPDANFAALKNEDAHYLEKPWVQLVTQLRYQKKYPDRSTLRTFEGLTTTHLNVTLVNFNPETSAADAAHFLKSRQQDVEKALEDEPYVFLAGFTGVGKSTFVRKEYKNYFSGETFKGMQAWAEARSDKPIVLFLDEANLSHQSWSVFEGLFNNPPSILIDGKPYELTPQHKVIFAGNPLSYGDERKIDSLFVNHGNTLIFEPLPTSVVYEDVIKPIFQDRLSPENKASLQRVLYSKFISFS